jgi:glycolate oxidase FAD binding subunit
MRPQTIEDLARIVAEAASAGGKLELRGGGTKAEVGAPREAQVVDMTGFSGIIDYDPAELVLTAGAGTPLSDIEAAVAERGQMLAFEPYGDGATLGGIVAAGVSGSRRLSRGPVRDHLLGFKAVSGRGEAFVGGAKVVKNVTGYDLPKVICGSWGRLAALTEVTLKVLPRAPVSVTLAVAGLEPEAAVGLMATAMGSQADVAAAAHVPGLTVLRLEGFGPSVAARRAMLESMTGARALAEDQAEAVWRALRTLSLLGEGPLWRIVVPPSRGPQVIAALNGDWMMDWAGGLVWLVSQDAEAVRAAAQAAGGHATLLRAPEAMRRSVPALHPQAPGVAALEARVRHAFDPMGVFETGRF